jgi:[ribosomal protein S18]-alanine N-acetyltransferase
LRKSKAVFSRRRAQSLTRTSILSDRGQVKIRRFSPGDVDSVLEVQNACKGITTWRARDYEQMSLDPRGMLLVAEGEGRISQEIVGFSACYRIETEAEVWNIAVAPAHRRRGVAWMLLTEICEQLSEAGVSRLFLEVRESNLPAVELYRSFGFAPLARRKDYYQNPREDALLLVIKIPERRI